MPYFTFCPFSTNTLRFWHVKLLFYMSGGQTWTCLQHTFWQDRRYQIHPWSILHLHTMKSEDETDGCRREARKQRKESKSTQGKPVSRACKRPWSHGFKMDWQEVIKRLRSRLYPLLFHSSCYSINLNPTFLYSISRAWSSIIYQNEAVFLRCPCCYYQRCPS